MSLPGLEPFYSNLWLYSTLLDQPISMLLTLSNRPDRKLRDDLAARLSSHPIQRHKLLSDHNILGTELALSDLLAGRDPVSQTVAPFIKRPSSLTDQNYRNFFFYLIMFRGQSPGQFFAVQPLLVPIFEGIGFRKVFQAIGPELLFLCDQPPADFFITLSFDSRLQISLFASHPLYSSLDFCRSLQVKFTSESAWPRPFQGSQELSFANTAIQTGRHFFDNFCQGVVNYLVVGDFFEMPPHVATFPDVIPYLLVANQPILYSDLENGMQILRREFSDSPVDQTLRRMTNDHKLLRAICDIIGDDVPPRDLIAKTLPQLLMNFLEDNRIFDYADCEFFSLTEANSAIDFDFLR
jgi:hypothetical protein